MVGKALAEGLLTRESAGAPLGDDEADLADLAELLAPVTADAAPAPIHQEPANSPAHVLGAAAGAGAGRRFHPLPGTPLAVAVSEVALLAAAAGTTVHAVEACRTVHSAAGALRVLTETGLDLEYGGVTATGLVSKVGTAVAAGAVLGVLGSAGDSLGDGGVMALSGALPAGYSWLSLRITDGDGAVVDAVALLVGLTDPAELGVRLGGAELGLDPDSLDRELGLATAAGLAL